MKHLPPDQNEKTDIYASLRKIEQNYFWFTHNTDEDKKNLDILMKEITLRGMLVVCEAFSKSKKREHTGGVTPVASRFDKTIRRRTRRKIREAAADFPLERRKSARRAAREESFNEESFDEEEGVARIMAIVKRETTE